MKKTIAILLSMLIIMGLAACGNSASSSAKHSVNGNSMERGNAAPVETVNEDHTESTGVFETQPEETETPEEQEAKVLVAYFSATNTTEGVAEHIANGLGADLYEITPEDPYTDADLNYNDNDAILTDQKSATSVLAMRQASKNIMYTMVNSYTYNNYNPNEIPGWIMTFYVVDAIVLLSLAAAEFILLKNRKKKTAVENT